MLSQFYHLRLPAGIVRLLLVVITVLHSCRSLSLISTNITTSAYCIYMVFSRLTCLGDLAQILVAKILYFIAQVHQDCAHRLKGSVRTDRDTGQLTPLEGAAESLEVLQEESEIRERRRQRCVKRERVRKRKRDT